MNNLEKGLDILYDCLKKSFAELQEIKKTNDVNTEIEFTRRFQSSIFFKEWFKIAGKSYYFVFKKNLKVTNIQYAWGLRSKFTTISVAKFTTLKICCS